MHALLFLAIAMGLALGYLNFLHRRYLDSSSLVLPVMPAAELDVVVALLLVLVVPVPVLVLVLVLAVAVVVVVDSAALVAVAVVDSIAAAVRLEVGVLNFVRLSSVRT